MKRNKREEIYIQFPKNWEWKDVKIWLLEHNIKTTKKASNMPYRWGAWRPLKNCKLPIDVYIFCKRNFVDKL